MEIPEETHLEAILRAVMNDHDHVWVSDGEGGPYVLEEFELNSDDVSALRWRVDRDGTVADVTPGMRYLLRAKIAQEEANDQA